MTPPKRYGTPAQFKVALEDRLKKRAQAHEVAVNRVRQRFIMERYLARVTKELGTACVLKGGLALELRIADARSTRDIDLRAAGDADKLLGMLQNAAAHDLGDYLTFRIDLDPVRPEIEDAVYEGKRFRGVAALGGQPYGSPFGLDIAMGDPMHGAPEVLSGEDYLDFVGVAPVTVQVYPAETHVAEKLHAYTKPPPPGKTNSRVRDLPDLALLATTKAFEAVSLRAALTTTFGFRNTHPLPDAVPVPPEWWTKPYEELAREHVLAWKTLPEVTGVVRTFLGPLLAGGTGRWVPAAWRWEATADAT